MIDTPVSPVLQCVCVCVSQLASCNHMHVRSIISIQGTASTQSPVVLIVDSGFQPLVIEGKFSLFERKPHLAWIGLQAAMV